eukprot:8648278-Pyramimonas_sp.AAC.1
MDDYISKPVQRKPVLVSVKTWAAKQVKLKQKRQLARGTHRRQLASPDHKNSGEGSENSMSSFFSSSSMGEKSFDGTDSTLEKVVDVSGERSPTQVPRGMSTSDGPVQERAQSSSHAPPMEAPTTPRSHPSFSGPLSIAPSGDAPRAATSRLSAKPSTMVSVVEDTT